MRRGGDPRGVRLQCALRRAPRRPRGGPRGPGRGQEKTPPPGRRARDQGRGERHDPQPVLDHGHPRSRPRGPRLRRQAVLLRPRPRGVRAAVFRSRRSARDPIPRPRRRPGTPRSPRAGRVLRRARRDPAPPHEPLHAIRPGARGGGRATSGGRRGTSIAGGRRKKRTADEARRRRARRRGFETAATRDLRGEETAPELGDGIEAPRVARAGVFGPGIRDAPSRAASDAPVVVAVPPAALRRDGLPLRLAAVHGPRVAGPARDVRRLRHPRSRRRLDRVARARIEGRRRGRGRRVPGGALQSAGPSAPRPLPRGRAPNPRRRYLLARVLLPGARARRRARIVRRRGQGWRLRSRRFRRARPVRRVPVAAARAAETSTASPVGGGGSASSKKSFSFGGGSRGASECRGDDSRSLGAAPFGGRAGVVTAGVLACSPVISDASTRVAPRDPRRGLEDFEAFERRRAAAAATARSDAPAREGLGEPSWKARLRSSQMCA